MPSNHLILGHPFLLLPSIFPPHISDITQYVSFSFWRLFNCLHCVSLGLDYCCLFAKSCLTLWWPHGLYPARPPVHGISQARILEWVAIFFSRGSSWPRGQTHLSCVGRWIFHHWPTREALRTWLAVPKSLLPFLCRLHGEHSILCIKKICIDTPEFSNKGYLSLFTFQTWPSK